MNPGGTLQERSWRTWITVAGFAVAMAWVESAVVFYLRTLVDRIEPYQANPLPLVGGLGRVELVRESATLAMLLAVGILAGQTWRHRFAYSAIAFGIWDIFYYVFLKVMCDWPRTLLDWDILFLLPLPWWGPVAAPMLIALLMIIWGTLEVRATQPYGIGGQWFIWSAWLCGIVLALAVFMADALKVLEKGEEAVRNVLPEQFAWGWFGIALLLMFVPIAHQAWGSRSRRTSPVGHTMVT